MLRRHNFLNFGTAIEFKDRIVLYQGYCFFLVNGVDEQVASHYLFPGRVGGPSLIKRSLSLTTLPLSLGGSPPVNLFPLLFFPDDSFSPSGVCVSLCPSGSRAGMRNCGMSYHLRSFGSLLWLLVNRKGKSLGIILSRLGNRGRRGKVYE